jgi:hypothetical protein
MPQHPAIKGLFDLQRSRSSEPTDTQRQLHEQRIKDTQASWGPVRRGLAGAADWAGGAIPDFFKGALTGDPTQPAPSTANAVGQLVAMAGLPFWHNMKQLRRIAGGYGKVPFYHGTTADNAIEMLKRGIKLPQSGEEAAANVAKRYDIPWSEWRHRVEPGGVGSHYYDAPKKLSTAPYPIAEQWGSPGAFPQGEIYSDLNSKARLYAEAKRRGISVDDMYDIAAKASHEKGLPSMYYWPDAVGAENRMRPNNPGGAVMEIIVKGQDIPVGVRREAQSFIRFGNKGRGSLDTLKDWNTMYQDIKIDPRKIQRIKKIK